MVLHIWQWSMPKMLKSNYSNFFYSWINNSAGCLQKMLLNAVKKNYLAESDITPHILCPHTPLQPLHHLTPRQGITPLVHALRETLRQVISAFNKRKQLGESNSPFTLTEALYIQHKQITHFISRIILLFH
jgi:hypothetical protein